MRPDSFFSIGLLIAFAIVAIRFVDAWRGQKADRLRVLERALADPNLDGETKRTALEVLDGGGGLQRWMFGIGWLMLMAGIAFLAFNDYGSDLAGAMMTALGFGLVSLPLALREVEARRSA